MQTTETHSGYFANIPSKSGFEIPESVIWALPSKKRFDPKKILILMILLNKTGIEHRIMSSDRQNPTIAPPVMAAQSTQTIAKLVLNRVTSGNNFAEKTAPETKAASSERLGIFISDSDINAPSINGRYKNVCSIRKKIEKDMLSSSSHEVRKK